MGAAEYVAIGCVVFGVFCTVLGFLLAPTIRGVARHDVQIAELRITVPEHGSRLQALEVLVQEIKGDVREIKGDMRQVVRYVESQSDPSRHRRATDHPKGSSAS